MLGSPTTTSRNSNYARRHRLHAIGLALASIIWHVWLSAYLSSVASGLGGDGNGDDGFAGRDGDDARDWEGAERRRIEGVRALLGIAWLWSWSSAGVALGGLFGILTDHLAFIRLFMLNGFLSLSLDLILLSTIFLILTVANPSSASGSSGLATTVCQAVSSSVVSSSSASLALPFSIGLPDLLGLSLEACEEQFEGVLVTALGALAVVEGARAWVAVRVLGYYALLVRSRMSSSTRMARGGDEFYDSPVELDGAPAFRSPTRSSSSTSTLTPHANAAGKKKRRESHGEAAQTSAGSSSSDRRKQRDRERSGSLRSNGDKKRHGDDQQQQTAATRIFLLRRSEDRGKSGAAAAPTLASMSQKEQEVPLLALTTSSPISSTFPPMRHHPDVGAGRDHDGGRRVLVYAPVLVSPEEARSLGATEVVLGSSSSSSSGHHHHPPRRRGDSHPPPRATPHASTSRHHHGAMQEPMTPVRSRSSTITPGSSSSTSNSGETTPKLGSTVASLGGSSGLLSPVKTGSPLRPSGTSASRPVSSLKIDAALSTLPHPPTRQDSEDAKTPLASSSGQNLALALVHEDKGNKLA
ncbi:hypothetical protein JCM10908_003246 [Rhodotorula pacifica]|uniref:uncharacterized protein n=1 Tax=Rhodotorula pacifica TaxID=1495444 RepID=UPI003176DB2C